MNDEQTQAWRTAYEDEIAQVIEESRPRCATCRWWRNPESLKGLGACQRFPTWGLRQTGELNRHITGDALAFVPGGALDSGQLVTLADFGCVQHEPKVTGHE